MVTEKKKRKKTLNIDEIGQFHLLLLSASLAIVAYINIRTHLKKLNNYYSWKGLKIFYESVQETFKNMNSILKKSRF